MKKNMGLLFVSMVMLGVSSLHAESLLEIRGGVGIVASDPKEFNQALKDDIGDGLDSSDFTNYNLDVFF